MPDLLCTSAIGLASLSITLQAVAAIARPSSPTSKDNPSAVTITPDLEVVAKPITTRPVLQEHARTIGIDRSKSWIHGATRAELQAAIRAHNEKKRGVTNG